MNKVNIECINSGDWSWWYHWFVPSLAMDMLQPKKHQFIGCSHIFKSQSFILSWMMMKLDMIFTEHGWIWDKVVIKLDGLGIWNVYKCFLMLFTIMRFASDEICVEIEQTIVIEDGALVYIVKALPKSQENCMKLVNQL